MGFTTADQRSLMCFDSLPFRESWVLRMVDGNLSIHMTTIIEILTQISPREGVSSSNSAAPSDHAVYVSSQLFVHLGTTVGLSFCPAKLRSKSWGQYM